MNTTKKNDIPDPVNRFKIIGKLLGVAGDKATIETTIASMATGKPYVNTFPIEVSSEQAEVLAPLVDTTVGVVGYVEKTGDSPVSWLKALEIKALPNAAHHNRMQLTGPVYGADLMSRTADKRQMGNVSFVIASRILNAVTWRGAVTELKHEGVKQNAVITLKGRARLREYESRGEMFETIELTCDQSADVKVHYVPDESDEFALDGAEAQAPASGGAPVIARKGRKRNAV